MLCSLCQFLQGNEGNLWAFVLNELLLRLYKVPNMVTAGASVRISYHMPPIYLGVILVSLQVCI